MRPFFAFATGRRCLFVIIFMVESTCAEVYEFISAACNNNDDEYTCRDSLLETLVNWVRTVRSVSLTLPKSSLKPPVVKITGQRIAFCNGSEPNFGFKSSPLNRLCPQLGKECEQVGLVPRAPDRRGAPMSPFILSFNIAKGCQNACLPRLTKHLVATANPTPAYQK